LDPDFDMNFTRKTPLRRGFLRFVIAQINMIAIVNFC
jgi:hypothetical protein